MEKDKITYPTCFGNWTNCDAIMEHVCNCRYLCYKAEEEKTDNQGR